ncbi:hypothetical protein M0Q50_01070 [bacterium]|jgi:glycosyltransferase involved in cell wall biosynthesis|nr:hypothetical protein [bacterium]
MIRILVLNSDTDGVGMWRVLSPNMWINNPEIKVDVRMLSDYTLPLLDPNFIKKYNIIFYNKVISFAVPEMETEFFRLLKEFNIKLIYDIDDYYILDPTHPNYKRWQQNNSQAIIEKCIKTADAVTTTTSIFADKIKPLNDEVYVLPNAVNFDEYQWQSNKFESDRIRFIWGGGISHLVDLNLLKDSMKKLNNIFLSKSQMVMCGYDLRMKMMDGSISKDNYETSTWTKFENIFTNDGKNIKSSEYRKFLKSSSNFDNDINYGRTEQYLDEYYQRRHTKSILIYGTMYNEADISIAPLKDNHTFNLMKSQLKLIEAGAHHCPVILSNYGPYVIDSVDGSVDGIQKGLLVNNNNEWYEKMKFYVDNPNAIIDHGEANYEYVKKNYSAEKVGNERISLYKDVASRERKN